MGDILFANESLPSTPAAGFSIGFVDPTTKKYCILDDAGRIAGSLSRNDAGSSQGPGFAVDTYVTNSNLLIPSFGMKAGQNYTWRITLSKTAAGAAATVLTFRIGTAGGIGDTARLTVTAPVAQTAAVSSGLITASLQVRNVGTSGVLAGGFGMAASVGLGSGADGVATAFDNSALGGQYVGISLNGGTSAVWTITSCAAELIG